MKLLTKDIERRLPELRAQEHVEDPIVYLKLFTPWSNWTWFITEYDPTDRLFFGMVHGLESEMGYISRDEIEALRGPAGLTIERDLHFKPQPLSRCKNPCTA